MTAGDAVKAALLLFAAAIVQVSVVSAIDVVGGRADVLLVVLVVVALARGFVVGAVGGFCAGLVVDAATLDTLGVSTLVIGMLGYWIGRYGETTGRDRAHAPVLAVVAATVLAAAGTLALHFVLGEHVSARLALVDALLPAILVNLLLTPPAYALCRRLLRPLDAERTAEVELLA